MDDYIIKRFENPDEVREFDKGKYEVINLPGMTIGKATYYKGWKWSVDVSPLSGTEFCETEHLGLLNLTIPTKIEGVDQSFLNPRNNWDDPKEYDEQAEKLVKLFVENIVSFAPSQDILDAGPNI